MKIIVTTSSFPANSEDKVPTFVLDQVEALFEADPNIDLSVLVPHNSYVGEMGGVIEKGSHVEYRFHYFWPFSAETLSGRGIVPALKENWFRVVLIPFFFFFQWRALSKYCDCHKPDLIYAHWFTPQAMIASLVSRKKDIPLVFTTHASDVSILRKMPFSKNLVSSVLNQATFFTAVSMRTAKKVSSFFSKEIWVNNYQGKMSVIPMGTFLPSNQLTEKEVSATLEGVGVDNNKKIVLSLGRLAEKKGVSYLLEAVSLLPSSILDAYQFVVAGDGQLRTQLQRQSEALGLSGSVRFTGYVSGRLKESLWRRSELFVLPSIIDGVGDSEGLPVSLLESLMYGKLIIATDVSGAEEIIDSSNGVLVPQKNARKLAEAIIALVEMGDNDKSARKEGAFLKGRQYQWPLIANRHLKVLREAVCGESI